MEQDIIQADLNYLKITEEAIVRFDTLAKNANMNKIIAEKSHQEGARQKFEMEEEQALESKEYFMSARELIVEKLISNPIYQDYLKEIEELKKNIR